MYTWVYKRKTPTRSELDPKSKQIECIRVYTSVKHLQEGSWTQNSRKQNVYMGTYAQNTSKKGVRPNKQANRIYTWVYKRKTPARRELDQKTKQIEWIRGYTSVKYLQEGSQTQKASKQNVYMGIQAQNTCKKGVRRNKQANSMYTWVQKRKTPARRELDPNSKKIECIHGYTSAKHLQEGIQTQKEDNKMYTYVYKCRVRMLEV